MLHSAILKDKLIGATHMPAEVMQYVFKQRWLQIWVPQQYCGLGLSFKEGLKVLKNLAQTDGSLGWMVTLCAGANYFSRNLKPETAFELFQKSTTCFGGSGMIGGTAERKDNEYFINGIWRFATGAPHLSHFTLNAIVIENGQKVLDEKGNELIRSFIIPQHQVKIIADWKAMGMRATGTYSFEIHNIAVSEKYSFIYNEFFTDSSLDKIPFRIFADLTLLVNYFGMAFHFGEEALKLRPSLDLTFFLRTIKEREEKVYGFADEIEKILCNTLEIGIEKQKEIHQFGEISVKELSCKIIELYTQLGIRASHTDNSVHQIFCDYFTASQHANFRPVY
ncbi:acyl-CoA dehydrogenase family protein [Myroides indicus]|uniref:Alkylation response protein AidB-like acyl-CoA dehydrogenase n=1 Tax=Myroides indicus TaxID=1323422 RepID=A0A4R7EUE0_9FLAO|nr:hypothetical protein [Myroides indicus]TDS50715.1 hypothetical protein C8P70_1527 [Myroides indicus]